MLINWDNNIARLGLGIKGGEYQHNRLSHHDCFCSGCQRTLRSCHQSWWFRLLKTLTGGCLSYLILCSDLEIKCLDCLADLWCVRYTCSGEKKGSCLALQSNCNISQHVNMVMALTLNRVVLHVVVCQGSCHGERVAPHAGADVWDAEGQGLPFLFVD